MSELAHFKKVFLNGPTPASFIAYFRSFQTNIITIFTTKICEKMSIQYTVPGFEPTNILRKVVPLGQVRTFTETFVLSGKELILQFRDKIKLVVILKQFSFYKGVCHRDQRRALPNSISMDRLQEISFVSNDEAIKVE